jgi:hypothetical protein
VDNAALPGCVERFRDETKLQAAFYMGYSIIIFVPFSELNLILPSSWLTIKFTR